MAEIKKATIDDVDVGKFKTRLNPRSAISSKAVVFRNVSGLYIGPYEGCCVLHRKFNRPDGNQWRAGSDAGSCGADWLPHAVAVSEEFEAWLVTELARIDREREEAARPKMPTVKAPDGMEWVALNGAPALLDTVTNRLFGVNNTLGSPLALDDERVFSATLTQLKARAEALGKRIVVAEEIERPMPANSLWKELR